MTDSHHFIFVPTVTKSDVWGIVDDDGQLKVPPVYTTMPLFEETSDQLLPVQHMNGQRGYLKADGSWLHSSPLEEARLFSPSGVSRFKASGKWGYIRANGDVIAEPEFEEVAPFGAGFGAVRTGDKWRYIDDEGAFIGDQEFSYAGPFSKVGLAPAALEQGGQIGFINNEAEWVIPPKFEDVRRGFSEFGLAPVRHNKKWGVIDTDGNWVVEPTFARMTAFDSKGYAQFSTDYIDGGFLNKQGAVVVNELREFDKLRRQPHCGLAIYDDWPTEFYELKDGSANSKLNDLKLKLTSRFDSECVAIALASGTDAWVRVSAQGQLYPLDKSVLEPYFSTRGESTQYAHTHSKYIPVVTRDRSLAYVDRQGKIALRAETLKSATGDVLIMRNARGEELWRQEYPVDTLIDTNDYPAFLNKDHREFGYTRPTKQGLKTLITKLKTDTPGSFDFQSLTNGERSGDSFGTGEHLAYAHYAYFDHAYHFHYAIDWPDFSDEFVEVKALLIELYGKPQEDARDLLDSNEVWANNFAVWQLDEGLLVLHDAYYEDGDVDYWGVLNLLLLPTEESKRAANNLPLVTADQLTITDQSHDDVKSELDKMERLMRYGNAIELRSSVVAVLQEANAGKQISAHDYLRTQHALLHAAYYDGSDELQIGSVDELVALSKSIMRFIEKIGLNDNELTAETQFRLDFYRRAANAPAWELRESDPKTALSFIEPAVPYFIDRDSFMYDTYVYVLLENGQTEKAFQFVYEVLQANPWFEHFQHFGSDGDYRAWLKKRHGKKPSNKAPPKTVAHIAEQVDVAVHASTNQIAMYKFDQLILIDAVSGAARHTLDTQSYDPFTIRFSQDGSKLVTSGWDATSVWDTSTGKLLLRQSVAGGNSERAGISNNGEQLVYDHERSFGNELVVRKLDKKQALLSINGTSNGRLSNDDRFMAISISGNEQAELRIIDLNAAKVVARLTGEAADPFDDDLFFVNNNRQLVVRDYSDFHLWDIATQKKLRTWDTGDFDVDELIVSNDFMLIFDGDSHQYRRWNFANDPKQSRALPIPETAKGKLGHEGAVLSADQQRIALVSHNPDFNLAYVSVIGLADNQLQRVYISPNLFNRAEFVDDDRKLVLDSYPLEIIDIDTGELVKQLR